MAKTANFGDATVEHLEAPCFGSPLDLQRLGLTKEQLKIFKGCLNIAGCTYPNLEYTPIVPAMLATFLKHDMNPDDALGSLAALIKGHSIATEKRLEWAYFPLDRRDFLVFQRVFEDLLKKTHPKIWRQIVKIQLHHVDYVPVWDQLLSRVFINIYPLWLVSRIVDAFLVEGYKIILRFSLAHLYHRRCLIYLAQSVEDLDLALFGSNLDITEAEGNRLVQTAFGLKFSRKDICRLRNRNRKLSFGDFDKEDRIILFHRPLPILKKPSEFVGEELWSKLWPWVPARFRLLGLRMIFSTSEHGRSLQTLYEKTGSVEPLLLIIETIEGAVLGTFISRAFSHRTGDLFFGSGETFIYSLRPEACKYSWNHASGSSSIIVANNKLIAFGTGPSGFGLRIEDDLTRLSTTSSITFDSRPLFEPHITEIHGLEIYIFD